MAEFRTVRQYIGTAAPGDGCLLGCSLALVRRGEAYLLVDPVDSHECNVEVHAFYHLDGLPACYGLGLGPHGTSQGYGGYVPLVKGGEMGYAGSDHCDVFGGYVSYHPEGGASGIQEHHLIVRYELSRPYCDGGLLLLVELAFDDHMRLLALKRADPCPAVEACDHPELLHLREVTAHGGRGYP